MRFHRNLKPYAGHLDVAPFAAVFFLLVLFLLLHTPMAPPPGLRLRLPPVNVSGNPGTPVPSLVVTVDRNNLVYYEHQVIREDELRTRLAARVQDERRPVALLVLADETAEHAAVVRLAAVARTAGIDNIVIGTRPPVFPESTNITVPP